MRRVLSIASFLLLAQLLGGAALAEPSARPLSIAWVKVKAIRQHDADKALRETLNQAAIAASARLGKPGAFAENPSHRVALPPALQAVRGSWNPIGRSGALDRLQAAMNQAAEAGALLARPLLLAQIEDLDFSDAVAIVRSGDEAATQFLAIRTRDALAGALRPGIENELTKAGGFAALAEAAEAAGMPERARGYRDEVIAATIDGELDALFGEMRTEERSIRLDPASRGSPVLQSVFSGFTPAAPQADSGG